MAKTSTDKCTENQRKYLMQVVDSVNRKNPKPLPQTALEKGLRAKREKLEAQIRPLTEKIEEINEQKRERAKQLNADMSKRATILRKDIYFLSADKANEAVQKFFDEFDPLVEYSVILSMIENKK